MVHGCEYHKWGPSLDVVNCNKGVEGSQRERYEVSEECQDHREVEALRCDSRDDIDLYCDQEDELGDGIDQVEGVEAIV